MFIYPFLVAALISVNALGFTGLGCSCPSFSLPSFCSQRMCPQKRMPCISSRIPRLSPLCAQVPFYDSFYVLQAPLVYTSQLDSYMQKLSNQRLTSLPLLELQKIFNSYENSVIRYNASRKELEETEQGTNSNIVIPGKSKNVDDLYGRIEDSWSSIILHELFFTNTATGTSPQPFTQYMMAKQFPTGRDFSKAMAEAAEEKRDDEDGWVAAVFDKAKEKIVIGYIPKNEFSRIFTYAPLLVIKVSQSLLNQDLNGGQHNYIQTYIPKDANWMAIDNRLKEAVSEETWQSFLRIYSSSSAPAQSAPSSLPQTQNH
ncbi:Iron/manganese Superoxide dismutase [Monocercomonoides exilis]|uniref:Iron/manganese Superoxide dismutase n=1 Tax=Monocercomonoides exilis TaxID=2049356 RepID=UPI00355A70DA|nr:Iron/manganese Superoxide dismutase [Monocercomonoides exilis]|eukprot:MONOS_9947.1-p1 / transcript=MONOS_9947.1 / gene=MONOS_9947 / organism=Monocercomonoides_exilis_PA203 / gene_product=putative Iron/manganese Superoxide dismutase / transcript_product=putative Iron/manganese Superoxide dismutase / location=Mono_scaffold00430:12973-14537(-) / protein_length=315 / sequence_SO=supercontig / SO=protein_coding / is_pseudo=false